MHGHLLYYIKYSILYYIYLVSRGSLPYVINFPIIRATNDRGVKFPAWTLIFKPERYNLDLLKVRVNRHYLEVRRILS